MHKTIIEKWHEIWNKSHLYDWWPKASIRFDSLEFDEHNLFCKTLLRRGRVQHYRPGFQRVVGCLAGSDGWMCWLDLQQKFRERKVIRLRNAISHRPKNDNIARINTTTLVCFFHFIFSFVLCNMTITRNDTMCQPVCNSCHQCNDSKT